MGGFIADISIQHLLMANVSLIKTPYGDKPSISADITASGVVHPKVERFMRHNIYPFYSNTHSNANNGQLMSHYINESKKAIRKSVNAHPEDEVVFTGNGCSAAITHLIHSLDLRKETNPKTVVFISVAEHHSNHLPWTHLPIILEMIPLTVKGVIDIEELKRRIRKYPDNPKIGSFIAGSNVTGVIQPTYDLAKLMHKHGGLALMDYAGCAPYVPIDIHKDDESYFDAIFISPHKFLGGPGTPGLLIANHKLFRNDEPYCPSGGTVRFVCKQFTKYSDNIETKETGGTPNILGCIKAGLVFQMKDELIDFIQEREVEINRKVRGAFSRIPNLRMINPDEVDEQVPIYSFMVDDLHYNLVVALISDLFGVQTRGGVSCCSVLAQYLLHIDKHGQEEIYKHIIDGDGVPKEYGWCRVTFHYAMPNSVIDYILEAIRFVCKYGNRLQDEYEYLPKKNNWVKKGFERKFPVYHFDKPLEKNYVLLTKELLDEQIEEAYGAIGKERRMKYSLVTE